VIVAVLRRGLLRPARSWCAAGLLVGHSAFAAAPAAPPPAPALPLGPLVQFIDAHDSEDHTDISIEFACSARYVANVPASHGTSTTITFRLGPDCGTQFNSIPPELPLVGGGGHLVTGARLDSIVPGEITLQLTWARALDFVMAPTASGLGLRLRLLNTQPRKSSGFVAEVEPPAGYSINLDSSQSSYSHEAVEAAAAALQTQAYVSEINIEDQHWYRLRAGPFTTRNEAERVLKIAQTTYPRAWLAVNDEQTDLSGVERAGVESKGSSRGPTDPVLPDDERARILKDARDELEKHQFPEAVDLLTRLLRQPEYPARADAQELLGLTRERAGQMALAKAEYEEYLRRYPGGPGAVRVRSRLQALIAASLTPISTGEFGVSSPEHWTLAGSAAINYLYGKDQTVSAGTATTTNTLDSALVYGDFLVRDRGSRYDFTARVDGGYTQNIGSSAGGSQDRATAAYVELVDKNLGLTGRFGRQSLASQGVIGIFDGLYVGYQVNPRWSVSAAAGLPAYTGYSVVSGRQQFGTVTAEFDPFHQTWVFDAYLFDEADAGATERRSIGLQTRYSQAGRTAVALVDYDLWFQQLNSATLIGNVKMGEYWVLGFDADHRRSPLLELSNALIGQNAADINTLEHQFTPALTISQIEQLALARTATSNTIVISATRPLGERWQFMADLGTIDLSGTPASPGFGTPPVGAVPAEPSMGLDKYLTLQMSGSSLVQAGDLHIFSARADDSTSQRSTTLSWDARFVLYGNWRLGPRFSVEELDDPALGGRQMIYLPQVRGDWTNRFTVFEVTAGYQLQNQQALQQAQSLTGVPQTTAVDERSLFLSAAYRVRF
jgi:hypothetical protein